MPYKVGERVRPVNQVCFLITFYKPHIDKKVIEIDKALHRSWPALREQRQQPRLPDPFPGSPRGFLNSFCESRRQLAARQATRGTLHDDASRGVRRGPRQILNAPTQCRGYKLFIRYPPVSSAQEIR